MREAERRFNSTAMAVKQAEEDYFIARLNYASAQYDYTRYKANLEYVIGTPKGETIDG